MLGGRDSTPQRFCHGYFALHAHIAAGGGHISPTPELHAAYGTVLGWLAAHPLLPREFERLLAHRREHAATAEVREVCGTLLQAWGHEPTRRQYLEVAGRTAELPAWPAWEERPWQWGPTNQRPR